MLSTCNSCTLSHAQVGYPSQSGRVAKSSTYPQNFTKTLIHTAMPNFIKKIYNKITGHPSQGLNIQQLGFDTGTATTGATNALSSMFSGGFNGEQWRRQQFSRYASQMIDSNDHEGLKYLVRYLVDNRMLRRDGMVIPLSQLFRYQSNPTGFKLDMIDLVDAVDNREVTIYPMGAN